MRVGRIMAGFSVGRLSRVSERDFNGCYVGAKTGAFRTRFGEKCVFGGQIVVAGARVAVVVHYFGGAK